MSIDTNMNVNPTPGLGNSGADLINTAGMSKTEQLQNSATMAESINNGSELVASGFVQNQLRIPDLDLQISGSGNNLTVTYNELPVGGNPNDAPLRELTNQKAQEIVTRIRNTLEEGQGAHLTVSDVTVSAGGTAKGFTINVGGKFGWFGGSNDGLREQIQNEFDFQRAQEYASWGRDFQATGATYTPPGGAPIRITPHAMDLLIFQSESYQQSFGPFTRLDQ